MPIDKTVNSFAEAVADIPDGAVVFIAGFGGAGGMPVRLMEALRDQGARRLTMVCNTAGLAVPIRFGWPDDCEPTDHCILVENGQVAKVVASFPVSPSPSKPNAVERAYASGDLELEVIPQGTLAEQIRAAGAGVSAFYTRTSAGTPLGEGKETRTFGGEEHVLEHAFPGDVALIRARKADTLGNLTYRGTSRSFGPAMAAAAKLTIAEVDEVVEPGGIDPEQVHTPCLYVDRVVARAPDDPLP